MNIDVKEYAQAKLRCKLSGNASILADYIATQEKGFVYHNNVTELETDLSVERLMKAKKELAQKNIIKITTVKKDGRIAGQYIDLNFNFNVWGNE